MKFTLLIGVVFLVVWAGGAVFADSYGFASVNSAALGRGDVGVGLTSNEQTTYSVNPAALGTFTPWGPGGYSDGPKCGVIGEYGFSHDLKGMGEWTAAGSARQEGKTWGVGVGYSKWTDGHDWAAGFGTQVLSFNNGSTLAVGASVSIPHFADEGATATWDLGFLYTLPKVQVGSIPTTASAGFVARDLFGVDGRTYDAGVGLTAKDWRVGVDGWDVTNKFHRSFEFGGEYTPIQWATVRLGVEDHDFTWGLSAHYKGFSLDYGQISLKSSYSSSLASYPYTGSESGGTTFKEWTLRYAIF